jgi:hypothetical protein
LALLVAGQPQREPRVNRPRLADQPGLVDLGLVEGRVGHDEVELAHQPVRVVVVAAGLADVPRQPVDGEVEAAQLLRVCHLLDAVDAMSRSGAAWCLRTNSAE